MCLIPITVLYEYKQMCDTNKSITKVLVCPSGVFTEGGARGKFQMKRFRPGATSKLRLYDCRKTETLRM